MLCHNLPNFHIVNRPWGGVRMHNSAPCWIVYYVAPNARGRAFYQAYRPADGVTVPPDREPWTLDNKSLSPHGFDTLEEAAAAIEKYLKEKAHETKDLRTPRD